MSNFFGYEIFLDYQVNNYVTYNGNIIIGEVSDNQKYDVVGKV